MTYRWAERSTTPGDWRWTSAAVAQLGGTAPLERDGLLGLAALQSRFDDLASHTLKVALIAATYTPNATDTLAEILAHEITGTGYTAGGVTLQAVAVETDANNVVHLTSQQAQWTTATILASFALLYDATAGEWLRLKEFDGPQTDGYGVFVVCPDDSGWLYAQ